ncbi:related to Altered inheritance rate of mitochondria protein 25 [Saccharomycodes ludwigii]|uniref:Phospholipid scramblase n=1 Tax=Saccharomycodes ludwigii TaxID=36035 RepID=A0A376BAN7_9ASCO|nr:hypothetical protein SCDLUD_005106 [Saccharomycodes ludwigii]KAH3898771.1 hypothetical protein SCDLUD_005106 [Saccharomycodes ludwigii]SSD61200.1 related to Altered inheritance rate of mitochondria protein 25 [Saccharomycodes ludwigii]
MFSNRLPKISLCKPVFKIIFGKPTPTVAFSHYISRRLYSPRIRYNTNENNISNPNAYYYEHNNSFSNTNPQYNNNDQKPPDYYAGILNQPTLVIERKFEAFNIFLGVEQANKYRILDVNGNQLGYILESLESFPAVIKRQLFRTHRSFQIDVFDNFDNKILSFTRPFRFINSYIQAVSDNNSSNGTPHVLGESRQVWNLLRRKYELFETANSTVSSSNGAPAFNQFGYVDAPFLSFEFNVQDINGLIIGGVDRNWVGLAREFFTDTGVYVVRFDSSMCYEGIYPDSMLNKSKKLSYNERCTLLAMAISIDFDYFSRHSTSNGGIISTTDDI